MDNRYWVFGGCDYYARGGVYDLLDRCSSVEMAESSLRQIADSGKSIEWYQIVDVLDGRVVRDYGHGGFGGSRSYAESVIQMPTEDDRHMLE